MPPNKFNWIGYGAFPGLSPFRFGNVVAEDAAEARVSLAKLWREMMPIDPPDFEPQRGVLLFKSEG